MFTLEELSEIDRRAKEYTQDSKIPIEIRVTMLNLEIAAKELWLKLKLQEMNDKNS